MKARLPSWLHTRVSLWHIALGAVGALVGLEAAISIVLLIISASWRRRLRPVAGFPYLDLPEVQAGPNRLTVFSYGRDLYDAMLAAIDAAKERIYIESFIWKADEVGQEFKKHLIQKAAEGIEVYVLIDAFGNLVVPNEFKAFPPPIHELKYQAIVRPLQVLDPRRYALDHRKLLVVDGQISFIGGYNIGSLYASEWRDTHLRITGPTAADIGQSFEDFWNRNAPRRKRIPHHYQRHFDSLIRMHGNSALRLTFPIRDMYIEAIDCAEHHIYVTNAYFVPDHVLLDALKGAAARGVDVQVLVPWRSNHVIADWLARGYFTDCMKKGIRIFCYKRAMIHAKTCTIDGQWSTVGTANLDRLSSVGNYEINAEIYSQEVACQMDALFECDKTNAIELSLPRWQRRSWLAILSERVLAPLRLVT
ncbi:MAG: cardiolipin synthase B [Chloroflexi bacterium]|nr:MAG: cardiolipin synthase B [Chloroflexota bacterium]